MPSSLRSFLGSCSSLRKICMCGCPLGKQESEEDELLWSQGLASHALGKFSLATVQANRCMEDQSRVESGPHGTFLGVFDGHGGPEAAKFVRDQLFAHLTRFASEDGGMSAGALCKAFEATEEGFESLVTRTWLEKPEIASMGSCCLVGVICDRTLYVANLGDSRAVLGSVVKATGAAVARQLTAEHNACHEIVRRELQSLHPDDPHIVVLKHGVWRVKGLIQVSRSIGDMYLKKAEFNREPLLPKFLLAEAFEQPILSAEPSIVVHKIEPQDEFVIFASDGFWEHLNNDEAVDIVHNTSSREGIAKRLVRLALQEAAKKRETRYSDIKKLEKGVRRHFHDDITVIVVFIDHALLR